MIQLSQVIFVCKLRWKDVSCLYMSIFEIIPNTMQTRIIMNRSLLWMNHSVPIFLLSFYIWWTPLECITNKYKSFVNRNYWPIVAGGRERASGFHESALGASNPHGPTLEGDGTLGALQTIVTRKLLTPESLQISSQLAAVNVCGGPVIACRSRWVWLLIQTCGK